MTASEWIKNAPAVVLTCCALVVTGLVVRREFFARTPAAPDSTGSAVSGGREYAAVGHRRGPEGAPVSIVLFSDFECGYCARFAESLDRIRAEHPADIAVLYRHFPLPSHAHAVDAARASECAAAQGRFEPFHDALFAAQGSIGDVRWADFATQAGVPDLASFGRCMASAEASAAVERDTEAGERLGITGTPSFLINDRLFVGAMPLDQLRDRVRQALRSNDDG